MTYADSLLESGLDNAVIFDIMAESVITKFHDPMFPDRLINLSFKDYDLSNDKYRDLIVAFNGNGVRTTGTDTKIRHVNGMFSVVEPADGTEPVLPDNWRDYIKDA